MGSTVVAVVVVITVVAVVVVVVVGVIVTVVVVMVVVGVVLVVVVAVGLVVVVVGLAAVGFAAVVVVISSVEVVVVSSVVVVVVVVDTSCGRELSEETGVCPQAASRVIQRSAQKSCIPIRFINILLYIMAFTYIHGKDSGRLQKTQKLFCKFYVLMYKHQSTYNIAFFSP